MFVFKQAELSPAYQYKILSGSIIPRPIAWISTLGTDGETVNLAPFSLFTIVSKDHPLVSVSIMRVEGEQKDTAFNLSQTGSGVIHLVNEDLVDKMNLTAATLPRHESEVPLTNLELIPSEVVSVPALAAAKARFEVKVYQEIPIKAPNSETVISDLFVLEVVAFHLDQEIYDPEHGYISAKALNPIARLAGAEYGLLGEGFTLERPR